MAQFPPQPLNYSGPAPQPPSPQVPRTGGRRLLGWVLFIGLAVMLFIMLSKQGRAFKTIPLSEFVDRLDDNQIRWMSLEDNEIRGQFVRPQAMADGTTVRDFRTQLPPGMGANWSFVQWLLDKSRNTGIVEVQTANNYVINILLPLIPWLLIFGFIWFFVFRQLRGVRHVTPTQIVFTGPGRWIPDEPGKAAQQ